MSRSISDNEILEALNGQNPSKVSAAMDSLYQSTFPSVSAYVLKNSGSADEAHDVFQDTLVVFYMKVKKGNFKMASSLKTYLFAVAKNIWLKQLRKKKKIEHQFPPYEPYEYPEELILQENQITIRKALELIDEECRRLLTDFYFESKPVRELKVRYQLGSLAATKNKKYRCLQKLVAIVKQRKWGREDFLDD